MLEIHKMLREHLAKHLGSLPEHDGTGKDEEADPLDVKPPRDDSADKPDPDDEGPSDALGEDTPDEGHGQEQPSDATPDHDGTGKDEKLTDTPDPRHTAAMKRLDQILRPKKG